MFKTMILSYVFSTCMSNKKRGFNIGAPFTCNSLLVLLEIQHQPPSPKHNMTEGLACQ